MCITWTCVIKTRENLCVSYCSRVYAQGSQDGRLFLKIATTVLLYSFYIYDTYIQIIDLCFFRYIDVALVGECMRNLEVFFKKYNKFKDAL